MSSRVSVMIENISAESGRLSPVNERTSAENEVLSLMSEEISAERGRGSLVNEKTSAEKRDLSLLSIKISLAASEYCVKAPLFCIQM